MGVSKEDKKAKNEAKQLQKLKAAIKIRKKVKGAELQRELAAQSLTKKQLDQAWLDLMLKIKEPEFKQDTEILWHIFERTLDKKDHLITYTMKLMDVADDQFQRTVASFCVTIDVMIEKFLNDFDLLYKENKTRSTAVLKGGEEEFKRIMKDQNEAETHLQLMMFHNNCTTNKITWEKRGEYIVKQEEDRTKFTNERDNLQSFLEKNYVNVWDEYKNVLKKYVIDVGGNQKKVRKLRMKENIIADIINSQAKKIANSSEMLRRLHTELASYESGNKQAVFRDRRNRHRVACQTLKHNQFNQSTRDVNQMALLVKASSGAIERLEYARHKAEKILRMAALCRKFETRREKVMPFGSTSLPSPTRDNRDDALFVDGIFNKNGLTKLWQRISRAELAKRALYREKQLLEQENAFIERKIQEYKNKTFEKGSQPSRKKGTVNQPSSIEGVLEVSKYKRV